MYILNLFLGFEIFFGRLVINGKWRNVFFFVIKEKRFSFVYVFYYNV